MSDWRRQDLIATTIMFTFGLVFVIAIGLLHLGAWSEEQWKRRKGE